MQLDQALTSRDLINERLRTILDDATDKWGVRVVRVEIQRIDPPPDVVDSMHNQMKAERNRRAVVTEATGFREAAITRAEGEKQSAILEAEGQKQSVILQAQGDAEAVERLADAERYRLLAVAEGEAGATRAVYGAIHDGDPTPDLLAIKYLEALARRGRRSGDEDLPAHRVQRPLRTGRWARRDAEVRPRRTRSPAPRSEARRRTDRARVTDV